MYTLLPATGVSGVFYLGLGMLAVLLGTGSILAGAGTWLIEKARLAIRRRTK